MTSQAPEKEPQGRPDIVGLVLFLGTLLVICGGLLHYLLY